MQIWKDENRADTIRIKAINKVINEVYLRRYPDSAFIFATEANKLAKKIKNKRFLGDTYNFMGISSYFMADFESAIKYYKEAIVNREASGRKDLLCGSLGNLGSVYMDAQMFDEALSTNMRFYEVSKEINDLTMQAHAANNVIRIQAIKGDIEGARNFQSKCLAEFRKTKDQPVIASLLIDFGFFHFENADYVMSIKYFMESLKIYESLKDYPGTFRALSAISTVYHHIDEFEKSLTYNEQCIEIDKNHPDAISNSAKSQLYYTMGRNYRGLSDFQNSLKYHFKSVEIGIEEHNNGIIAANYDNIGNTYLEMHDLKMAEDYLIRALDLSNIIGDSSKAAWAKLSLSRVNRELNNIKKAIKYSKEAFNFSDHSGELKLKADAAKELWLNNKVIGKSKEALEMHELYVLLKDSIDSDINQKAVFQEQFRYQYEKDRITDSLKQADKDRIAIQDKEKLQREKDQNRNIGVLVGVSLFSIGFILFFLLRKNKRSLSEANALRERAERSEDVKRRFLANMSHEIRTPMNAVTGMTSLVLETELDIKQRSYLEKVRTSSENLLQIINDILDFSKIEVGKMELEQLDFSIKDVVDQVKQVVKHKADEKGLELIIMIDPRIDDIVLGDPLRLNQILINLAGNAIKFTEKGSVTIEITPDNQKVKFSLIDTGIGIPPDKLRFVFDSFNQANASDTRKYGGTGLGLSISQQLVELMGGSIDIKSEVGRGTIFSFEVLFEQGDKKRYLERLTDDQHIDGSILDGLKIMIADDNEYNRIVARDMLLSRAKVEIVEAENGQDAIDKLDESIDVILMDGQMPILNGFDATRMIRSKDNIKLRTMPIISFTASVMRSDLDKCRDAGMDGFIPKPFKVHDLIKGIASELKIELRHLNPKPKEEEESLTIKPNNIADLNYLKGFCEGDTVKMKKYIDIFLKSVPGIIETLDDADEANDLRTIADQIHGYKTKLIMMGMSSTKELSVELEILCREKGDRKEIDRILGIIKNNLRLAVEELITFSG